jgi:hypothetical protein
MGTEAPTGEVAAAVVTEWMLMQIRVAMVQVLVKETRPDLNAPSRHDPNAWTASGPLSSRSALKTRW